MYVFLIFNCSLVLDHVTFSFFDIFCNLSLINTYALFQICFGNCNDIIKFEHFVSYYHIFTAKYASQFGAGSQYAYYHEGDDTSFQLVDTSKPHKTAYQRNKQRFNNVGFC